MKLVVFDMDQTLVDFLPVHDEAARRLFKEFFGVNARLSELDFSGKSLIENFNELARLKNIREDAFQGRRKQLLQTYETAFGESLPRNATKYILPGVKKLLNGLSKTDHVVALYTGDSREIVNQVFRATGLGRYFKFRFYGTEVESRTDMIRLAIAEAKKLTGQRFEGKNLVIIGDSVRDVECGKAFGALIIAVATGVHSQEELREAGADYVFGNLRDYRKVLQAIDR